MGLRALSFESLLTPPKRHSKRPKPRECSSCGETTNYDICAACTDRGVTLQALFATYDETKFNPISPIPEDIYTVLALAGKQTLERLRIEVNITAPLLDIYLKRLMRKGTIVQYERRNKRGQVQSLVALTDEGKLTSRTFQIMREFEERYGELQRNRRQRIESLAG